MLVVASLVASDEDYSLFSVVIFRRVHDDFVQKCREHKWAPFATILSVSLIIYPSFRFIVRDFHYSEEEIAKQQQELETAATTEKELWV
jgi:V-type H+-transporting ATPase subunit C